jgi:hypothetical protein
LRRDHAARLRFSTRVAASRSKRRQATASGEVERDEWLAQARAERSRVEPGTEEHQLAAEGGQGVAMALEDAFDEALTEQVAEVVGHLAVAVGTSCRRA